MVRLLVQVKCAAVGCDAVTQTTGSVNLDSQEFGGLRVDADTPEGWGFDRYLGELCPKHKARAE